MAGIKELGKHKLFTECLTEKALESHQQEDIIIKIWAQLTVPETGLDNKDIRGLYETLEITDEVKDRITAILDMIYDTKAALLENDRKKTAKKIVTKTHLISVSYIADKAVKDGKTPQDFANCLDQFFDEGSPSTNDAYNAACKEGSNHATNVSTRLKELGDEYNWYFNGDSSEDDDSEDDE